MILRRSPMLFGVKQSLALNEAALSQKRAPRRVVTLVHFKALSKTPFWEFFLFITKFLHRQLHDSF